MTTAHAPDLRPPQPPVGWSRLTVAVFVGFGLLEACKLAAFHLSGPLPRALDAATYWQLGEQVADGDVAMRHHATASRTPGYPWFLGLLVAVCGDRAWWTALLLQSAAVWVTTVLVGWWTWRLTQQPWWSIGALAICLLSGARASYAGLLLTETLFTLCLTAFACRLTHPRVFATRRSVVLLGSLWCLAWLLRPVAVALWPAWLIAWWLAARTVPAGPSRRRVRLTAMGLTFLVLAVGLGPWMARNLLIWQRPAITVFVGREAWNAVYGPGSPEPPSPPASPAAQELAERVLAQGAFSAWRNNWAVSDRLTASGLSDVEADDFMRRVAWDGVVAHPGRTIGRMVWRGIDFWRVTYLRSPADYDDWRQSPAIVHDQQHTWSQPGCQRFRSTWLESAPETRLLVIELTSLAALVGLAGLWLSPATLRTAIPLTALVAGIWLTTAAFEGPAYRYRMVLEPILIVSGLTGWQVLFAVVARGRRQLWEDTVPALVAPE